MNGASASGAGASSGNGSDSVSISPEGASLAAQLVGPDGSFDPVMANALLDASVNQSLFASLSGVDSASFSLTGMMLAGGANTTGDSGNIAQLTELAATASLYAKMPSSVTQSAISMYMPALAAYAPPVNGVQSSAQVPSASAAAMDNGVSPLTDP
jgi:hypothetical protein